MAQKSDKDEITRLLKEGALEEVAPLVQDELIKIARQRLRKKGRGGTIDTHALLSEVYKRLVDGAQAEWQDRNHFFALASKIMRDFLFNYNRDKEAQKRGGSVEIISLQELLPQAAEKRETIIVELHEALLRLEKLDEQQSQVVELRFFGGLGMKETAEILGLSLRTVERKWKTARLWLLRELSATHD